MSLHTDHIDGSGLAGETNQPRVLFLATEDWAFCQHFMPLLRTVVSLGFTAAVAGKAGTEYRRILEAGAGFIPLDQRRGSFMPLQLVRNVQALSRVIRGNACDIVHCVGLRMSVLGGIAARLARYRGQLIIAPTGLGHIWIADGISERTARLLVRGLMCFVLKGSRTQFLFENSDDPKALGLASGERITIVNGAGVDPEQFPQAPPPEGQEIRVAVVARMLKPKGIAEAVAATVRARSLGAPVSLHLFGDPDPENPESFTPEDLDAFTGQPGVFWHGKASDIASVYRAHHIAMLLSYREGLPRALVEAAAIGRPIIATDVPGCRAIVRDGIDGFVVPSGDIELTARRLVTLAGDASLRAQMGDAARQRFEDNFTEQRVCATFAELYRDFLVGPGPASTGGKPTPQSAAN